MDAESGLPLPGVNIAIKGTLTGTTTDLDGKYQIQADEGDIFLRDVDVASGVVSVELTGACVTCPVSTATLKDGIERILKKRVEGVTSVVHVGAELAGTEMGTAVSL